jgi:hypothetical protein
LSACWMSLPARTNTRTSTPAVRELIADVVLEVEREPLEESARRVVDRLSAEELAQLVADWLDARTAI